MITWEKLDTFVLSNPTFKVVYPDNFVPDNSLLDNRNMRFDYSFAGCEVFLKCFSYPNDAHMDDSAAVEFSVGIRKSHEDSIIKNEKKEKAENRKNVGSTISKKFNRLMMYDNFNKIKKTKLLLDAAATCNKLVELEQEKRK